MDKIANTELKIQTISSMSFPDKEVCTLTVNMENPYAFDSVDEIVIVYANGRKIKFDKGAVIA